MSHPHIFVHIASYRDRECQWTVRDLFTKARHPERIFVGICWQTIPELDADCFRIETRPSQVRAVHFHVGAAEGLGWARQQSQSLWHGEPYCLQIDSHMRFIHDWDEAMLDMLAACDSAEPVLTVYPRGYTPPDRLDDNDRPFVQFVKGFTPNGLLEFSAAELPAGQAADRPMPTAACAGGFIFGPSRILQDVPPDPEVYFNGEEQNLAVRLWTAGFDLFSPSRTLIYHYYGRKEGSRHWNDATAWSERHRHTLRRMRALCNPSASTPEEVAALGPHGLGSRRSLAEYQAFSGVDFAGRTIADYARGYPYIRRAASNQPATLPGEDLVPVADAHFFLLGDEGLLFRQRPGEFYRLNDSAAFAWCARQEGYSWSRIASEQSAARHVALASTTGEIANLAAHWLGQGLLCRAGEEPAPVPGSRRHGPCFDGDHFDFISHTYELLGLRMRVRYGDRELEHRIHPLLSHLRVEGTGSAVSTYTVARILDHIYLFRGDYMLHCGDNPAALAPLLKFQLSERAIQRQDAIMQIHAGAVECHGCLVLVPGQAGHGKTTLTARLVAAGGRFFSDEAVLLEREHREVRPIPMSLCVKAKGRALLEPYFPDLAELPAHLREDGLEVRYLPPPLGSLPPTGYSAEPRLMVFRRYVAGAPQALRKLSSTEAFGLLLDNCVAIPKPLKLTDAVALAGLIRRLDGYELTGSDLDQDAETVLDLCRRIGARETLESSNSDSSAIATEQPRQQGDAGPQAMFRSAGPARVHPARQTLHACQPRDRAVASIGRAPLISSPNLTLLLETARPQLSDRGEQLLTDALLFLPESDWEWLMRQALDHATAGLLCHHIITCEAAPKGEDLVAACRVYLDACAASFASGLEELRHLLDTLEAAGVDAMPIKGPGLACRIYTNPELRRFRDLDLLIRPAHRETALATLAALGYRGDLEDLPPSRLRDYHDYNGQDILFAHDRMPIEPHWALAPWTFGADIDVDALFARAVEFESPGLGRVRGLSPEDTLLFAAVHGSKEEWSRLVWLTDIAAIFAAWPALDSRLTLERATACGCRRMLLLAVLLARDLVGARVPACLADQAHADPAVPDLAAQVKRNVPLSQGETRNIFQLTRFRWRLRERVSDRMRYGLRTLFTPRVPHFRTLVLPDRLAFLYPAVRIIMDAVVLPLWRAWTRLKAGT